MEGERYRLPPVLFIGCDSIPQLNGIEEYIHSDEIEDHQVAIDGLKAVARYLERGEQIDRDPNGMKMTKHHLYGGPENAPVIADCRLARRFYTDPRNIMHVRRDVHTFIERMWGWLPLPSVEVMYEFVKESESNISSKTKKHIEQCIRGGCDGRC